MLQSILKIFKSLTIKDAEVQNLLIKNGWKCDTNFAFAKIMKNFAFANTNHFYCVVKTEYGYQFCLSIPIYNKIEVFKTFDNFLTEKEVQWVIEFSDNHFNSIISNNREKFIPNGEILVDLIKQGFDTDDILFEEAEKQMTGFDYFNALDYLTRNRKIKLIDYKNYVIL